MKKLKISQTEGSAEPTTKQPKKQKLNLIAHFEQISELSQGKRLTVEFFVEAKPHNDSAAI